MSKNKEEQEGKRLREEGKPRPKEPWFPTDNEKRRTVDRKIGWDKEHAKRKETAKKSK